MKFANITPSSSSRIHISTISLDFYFDFKASLTKYKLSLMIKVIFHTNDKLKI